MPYLTPPLPPSTNWCRRLSFPADAHWLALISGALSELLKVENYEQFDAATPEQCVEVFTEVLDRFWNDDCMIGSIVPYATTDAPHGTIPCDGGLYLRADYPTLYDLLDAVFVVDADTFTTPDLRGRAVFGAGTDGVLTDRAVGDYAGDETHTLTVPEMPSHDHTSPPHTHSEQIPNVNLDLEAPGVPDVLAGGNPPLVVQTGATAVTIDATGGGEAHNNMPPLVALNYCMVAF